MIVDYIDTHRGRFGVEPVCAVLAEAGIQVAPSTYYARRKASLTEAELERLRVEVAELRMDREFLKKATSYVGDRCQVPVFSSR